MDGNNQEAVGLYTQAIELDDCNVVFYANRANAYLEAGMHMNCIDDCKKAITIDNRFIKAYYRMAKAYYNIS